MIILGNSNKRQMNTIEQKQRCQRCHVTNTPDKFKVKRNNSLTKTCIRCLELMVQHNSKCKSILNMRRIEEEIRDNRKQEKDNLKKIEDNLKKIEENKEKTIEIDKLKRLLKYLQDNDRDLIEQYKIRGELIDLYSELKS